MIKLIIGVIIGIVVATIGFSGIAAMADKGVAQVQAVAKDAAKSDTATEVTKTVKKAVSEVTK
jgi:hypothetical protein